MFPKNRYDSRKWFASGTMKKLGTVSLWLLLVLGCVSQNHHTEGMRYYGQARYDAAVTAFQSVLKADPNDSHAMYNIAATYHQSARTSLRSGNTAAAQQQYAQAIQYYQLCLTQAPNHTNAYRGLSALYMDCRQPDVAFQLLINWNNANPVSSEPKIELARLYQEFAEISRIQERTEVAQQCREVAKQFLQQVVQTEPTNDRALRALGFLKEQSGDISGAIFEYQRSLQANPQQQDIAHRIAALTQQEVVAK